MPEPSRPATVGEALALAQALGVPRLDAQWLLGHHLQRSRSWLLAHDEAPLPAGLCEQLPSQLRRRAAGEPLAYLTGKAVFCGLELQVSPAVLIPRPETEDLVNWALELLAPDCTAEVLDLGTGSGAIALALAQQRPGLQVHASDASDAALAIAQANAQRLGLPLQLRQGSWWQAHAGQRFALVLSNPPYIAEGDRHLAALQHEPRSALTAGPQGLDDLREIVRGAPQHLLPGAWLLLEHGHDQGEAVQALLRQAGFREVATRADLAGLARCSGGRI